MFIYIKMTDSDSGLKIGFTGQPGQSPYSNAAAMQQAGVARQMALIGKTGGRRKYRGGAGEGATVIPTVTVPYNSGLQNGPSQQQLSGANTLLNGRAQATGDNVALVPSKHVGGYRYYDSGKRGRGKGKKQNSLRKTHKLLGGKRRRKRRQTRRK
jgi:hypothetical protein